MDGRPMAWHRASTAMQKLLELPLLFSRCGMYRLLPSWSVPDPLCFPTLAAPQNPTTTETTAKDARRKQNRA